MQSLPDFFETRTKVPIEAATAIPINRISCIAGPPWRENFSVLLVTP
jgi:hypothetical protein